uniref:Proline-rich protein 36-like n=1 Tax=Poecilia formosa TaxID=48698 RepID=A0A096M5Z0_POEFO
MMGGSETVSRDKDAVHAAAIHVPIGWLRRVERGQVTYVSPSGTTLSTLDEVKAYLLTDGTCKCGLECPLIIHKVFNFSVGVKVEQNSQPSCKAEQDMTKLCNHRRKVVAMAALCRSMQASQLPFTNFHHPVRCNSRGQRGSKKGTFRAQRGRAWTFLFKTQSSTNSGAQQPSPEPFPQPKILPSLHRTNCHHPLDGFRRHHHPPLPAASTASTSSSFPPHSPAQRSPHTPTPQNTNQGQITPKTPETPSSPWLGPLSSPPPSSPMTLGGVRGGQTHYPLTPLSPSNSFSPSVHPMGLPSHQRSRHPSASPSSASEHGGGSTQAEGGGGLMGNNLPHMRKSASSSPHSPVPGGSPLPSPHFPKYKLEDILEQFKNSGNSSTNNHHVLNPANPSLPTNQSSSHPYAVSSKPTKGTATAADSAGPKGFGLSQPAPSNLPLGPLLNHHYSHQGKLPHPVSFPASTLLSAAAKAQLANQITQGSNVSSSAGNLHSSLDVLKEAQQQQKVTNSTLHNSIASSSIPSQTLAQSLVSSSPHPPPTAERGASHRKRRRRSPTVAGTLRDTPPLANGVRKATPDEAASATVINLSSSSIVQNQSTVTLENHHPSLPRLSAPPGHLSRSPRPNETRSFTTAPTPMPLSIDPPTQPLSALLHLLSVQNAQASSAASTPLQRGSPCKSNEVFQSNSDPSQRTTSSLADTDQPFDNHIPTSDSLSQASLYAASPRRAVAVETGSGSPPTSMNLSQAEGNASAGVPSSPKPLDLSNHVLALFSAPSTATQAEGDSSNHAADADASSTENHAAVHNILNLCRNCKMSLNSSPFSIVQVEPEHLDPKTPPASTSPTFSVSAPHEGSHSPASSSSVGETAAPLALAEAFPFMNQEQLLQLLSSTGGLPSLLDSTVLASLPLGGLWLGGQHAQLPPASVTPQPPPNLAEPHQPEQPHLLPLLSSGQGELPLNLLGLLNPLAASAPSAGQEPDLTERSSLQALLMASVLVGQQPASLLPLSVLGHLNQISLEVPIQHSQHIPATLEGLSLDKTSGLLDPTSGLLDITHGLLPLTAGAENPIQALQSLLLPAALPPPPAAFLPLSPALLTAALSSAELHSPPNTQLAPAQQTQHAQPQDVESVSCSVRCSVLQVPTDAAVDTLIPVSLQGKDNPLLQQLLPTLLNPSMLGDVPGIAGLQNMVGLGAGSILLSPVQASALGLLQSPDGGINLLNNIQLNLAPPSDGEKPGSLQETQRPAAHEGLPASEIAPEVSPCPVSALAPPPAQESPPPAQRGSEGRSVIDPYTSFMDTIYTSFLQVSAKEQEDGAQNTPTLPQASAPASLSPRRACSLRNPDLSRLSLEAAAHSPAQGTPKPTEDGPTSPLQRKPVIEGHTHLEPPLHPVYLEEAKTDCTGPAAAVCPFVEMGVDRQGQRPHAGYLSPRDGRSERPSEETTETLLLTGQGMDQAGAAGGARRGRKRKQTLQNVLEDFRDMDATALEETKATAALLKPDRSVRGRRRRGTR